MLLLTNPASPFGRKVAVAARELGLEGRIEVRNEALTPVSPNDAVVAANPLGKIPCLVTDEGLALYDSRVIAEYLDSLAPDGRGLFPPAEPARWLALRLQALGDGIMDAGVNARYESVVRPEACRWADWVAGQKLKITRSLDLLEAQPEALSGAEPDIGQIAVACALGYLDFRYADWPWRPGRPRLDAWFERLSQRPSMRATAPSQI